MKDFDNYIKGATKDYYIKELLDIARKNLPLNKQ